MPAALRTSNHAARVAGFTLDLAPMPCPRPRVSKFGTYYPKPYAVWKKAAQGLLIDLGLATFHGPVEVSVECHCTRPKTTKLSIPRGDVDNYGKALLDAATAAGLWEDDVQVVALRVTKQWAPRGEPGRIVVNIAPID